MEGRVVSKGIERGKKSAQLVNICAWVYRGMSRKQFEIGSGPSAQRGVELQKGVF